MGTLTVFVELQTVFVAMLAVDQKSDFISQFHLFGHFLQPRPEAGMSGREGHRHTQIIMINYDNNNDNNTNF